MEKMSDTPHSICKKKEKEKEKKEGKSCGGSRNEKNTSLRPRSLGRSRPTLSDWNNGLFDSAIGRPTCIIEMRLDDWTSVGHAYSSSAKPN